MGRDWSYPCPPDHRLLCPRVAGVARPRAWRSSLTKPTTVMGHEADGDGETEGPMFAESNPQRPPSTIRPASPRHTPMPGSAAPVRSKRHYRRPGCPAISCCRFLRTPFFRLSRVQSHRLCRQYNAPAPNTARNSCLPSGISEIPTGIRLGHLPRLAYLVRVYRPPVA